MLVGSPPFKANTQETILRRIYTCDYRWPDWRHVLISFEAKEMVRRLLVKAEERWMPDEVVEHPFFTKGQYLEEIATEFRYEVPRAPQHGSDHDSMLYQRNCRLAGVGKGKSGHC